MPELQIDFEADGVVTVFDSEQHFALVRCTDGATTERIRVDRKCMKKSNVEALAQGTRVRCKVAKKKTGSWAKRIEVIP